MSELKALTYDDIPFMSHKEIFLEVYKQELIDSYNEDPTSYAWPLSELEQVFGRMRAAILKGSFNKDSAAFRRTCKKLKIKHTYRDIENYLGGYKNI
jgi:hypothetical protein